MCLIIDFKTRKVLNQPLKQPRFVEFFDVAITLFRMIIIASFLALQFNLNLNVLF